MPRTRHGRESGLHDRIPVKRRLLLAGALLPLMMGMLGCTGGLPGVHDGMAASGPHDTATIAIHAPPDEELERRLSTIFAQIEGLHDIEVRVRDGVVHLAGTTDNLALAQRAVGLAGRVEGVVAVSSEISSHASDRLFAATWRALRRLAQSAADALPQLSGAILAFAPFLLLSLLVGKWRHPLRLLGVRKLTGGLVRFALRGALLITGILVGLDVLGITSIVGAVVGTLGILGLAGGIVFKDWVANYLPAMTLGLHPPFKEGDLVHVGDHEGRVVQITPRATVLMTLDGAEIRLPNSALFERTLINYSQHRERRLRFVVPLAQRADLHLAQQVGQQALLHLRGVTREPPPFMRVRSLGRDFVEVEFFAWVDQDTVNFRTVESRARRAVLESLAASDVPFPADTRIVHLRRAQGARSSIDDDSREAEDRDDAFVEQQLHRARARMADEERDLLAESSPAP